MELKIREIPINFIVGYVRTGSTLLMALLREHPDIETDVQEPNWLYRLMNTEYRYDLQYKCLGIEKHPSMDMYWDSVKVMTKYYADQLCQKTGKNIMVFKHPYLSYRINLLQKLFWKARYIHIIRHPYDCLASAYHFTQLHWEAESTLGKGMEEIIGNYIDWMMRLIHAESILGQKLLKIKYEDLIERPKEMLAECLQFLEVMWTWDMVDKIIAKAQKNELTLVGGPLHSSVIGTPGDIFNTKLDEEQRNLLRGKKVGYFLEAFDYKEK